MLMVLVVTAGWVFVLRSETFDRIERVDLVAPPASLSSLAEPRRTPTTTREKLSPRMD